MANAVRLGMFSPSVALGVAAATGGLDRAGLTVEERPDNVLAHLGSAVLAVDVPTSGFARTLRSRYGGAGHRPAPLLGPGCDLVDERFLRPPGS